jgi:hypothetical protein
MIDKWLLEGCSVLSLAGVIVHDDDLWDGAPHYKRLRCPVCSETYQHTVTWELVPGSDAYEAGWGGRGDVLVIPMLGECEHRWDLCLGFHKGETFCFVRVLQYQERAA